MTQVHQHCLTSTASKVSGASMRSLTCVFLLPSPFVSKEWKFVKTVDNVPPSFFWWRQSWLSLKRIFKLSRLWFPLANSPSDFSRNVLLPKCLVHFVLLFCIHLSMLRDPSELSKPSLKKPITEAKHQKHSCPHVDMPASECWEELVLGTQPWWSSRMGMGWEARMTKKEPRLPSSSGLQLIHCSGQTCLNKTNGYS